MKTVGKSKLKWNIFLKRKDRSLIVRCPKCGEVGRLYFSKNMGFYVKHGNKKTHRVYDEALEIPLHDPRINLIRYIGSDYYVLPYLAKMIPPHTTYVEVFGGSAPLLLNKYPSPVEIYNDIDNDLYNLFKVVRENFNEFKEHFKWVIYSRTQYYQYLKDYKNETNPVKRAWKFFYLMLVAYSGKFSAGFSTGKTRNQAVSFFNKIKNLVVIHERLKNVVIESLDFRELIKRYDSEQTFFYVDPPHLFIVTEKSDDYYKTGGFTDKDFMDLLDLLEQIKGKFLLKQIDVVPWFREWIKKNDFSCVPITLTKFSKKSVNGARKPVMTYLFVSNYKVVNFKRKRFK
ncbi:MAG: hypothetical protein DRO01_00130 [Thermoproteota archaeon]|nr:MAG: hypothetical protein DRO01_00130 [Candidatus Korarchaeota archaeon]